MNFVDEGAGDPIMGKNFIQQDSPNEIGQAIANFIRKINQ